MHEIILIIMAELAQRNLEVKNSVAPVFPSVEKPAGHFSRMCRVDSLIGGNGQFWNNIFVAEPKIISELYQYIKSRITAVGLGFREVEGRELEETFLSPNRRFEIFRGEEKLGYVTVHREQDRLVVTQIRGIDTGEIDNLVATL
jgi:hypothetical protein